MKVPKVTGFGQSDAAIHPCHERHGNLLFGEKGRVHGRYVLPSARGIKTPIQGDVSIFGRI
jgi:hypothetical protein